MEQEQVQTHSFTINDITNLHEEKRSLANKSSKNSMIKPSIKKSLAKEETYENFEKQLQENDSISVKKSIIRTETEEPRQSVQKLSLKKESLKKESLKKESLTKESTSKQSLKKESLPKESLTKESIKKTSPTRMEGEMNSSEEIHHTNEPVLEERMQEEITEERRIEESLPLENSELPMNENIEERPLEIHEERPSELIEERLPEIRIEMEEVRPTITEETMEEGRRSTCNDKRTAEEAGLDNSEEPELEKRVHSE
jgi:hypothetical protein